MKILLVLTSHDQLGDTGKKTGFWLEEFAAPYYLLKDAGAEITLASPKGGQPPLDPKSDDAQAQTEATQRFKADPTAQAALGSAMREVAGRGFAIGLHTGGVERSIGRPPLVPDHQELRPVGRHCGARPLDRAAR